MYLILNMYIQVSIYRHYEQFCEVLYKRSIKFLMELYRDKYR